LICAIGLVLADMAGIETEQILVVTLDDMFKPFLILRTALMNILGTLPILGFFALLSRLKIRKKLPPETRRQRGLYTRSGLRLAFLIVGALIMLSMPHYLYGENSLQLFTIPSKEKYILLILINILLLFVGCFMETIAALLILFPVLLPVVTSVGVDPIQFGVMCVLNLVLGLTTPPVGVCLFVTSAIGKISLARASKAVMPFLLLNLGVLLLVSFCPPVTLTLVNLFF
jgi:hypothetical protein